MASAHAYVGKKQCGDYRAMVGWHGVKNEIGYLKNSYHGTRFHTHDYDASVYRSVRNSKRAADMALIVQNPEAYECWERYVGQDGERQKSVSCYFLCLKNHRWPQEVKLFGPLYRVNRDNKRKFTDKKPYLISWEVLNQMYKVKTPSRASRNPYTRLRSAIATTNE